MKLCMIGNRGHNGMVFGGLARVPHVKVVGVSAGTPEDSPDELVAGCRRHGQTPRVFLDWRHMLDELKPDVVSVAGPFERHAEMAIEAMGRGMHVFAEKPVALTLDELARLREAHARSKVHFAPMMGLRYDPAFYAAHRAVRDGAIGVPRLIAARKSYRLGHRPAYYTRRATYGGTIPWVGSHAIDWIHWFAGQPFRSVYAAHSTAHNHDLGDMEMSALCQFTLEGDVLASVSMDYLRPATAPSHGDDRIRVAGTEGVIEVRGGEVFLINGKTAGEARMPAACERQIFHDFVQEAEGKGKAILGPADAFAATEACLLARQSADERRLVEFPVA